VFIIALIRVILKVTIPWPIKCCDFAMAKVLGASGSVPMKIGTVHAAPELLECVAGV